MYFRQPAGITRTHVDACHGCQRFLGGNTVCKPLEAVLAEALRSGMHLDVVYCPERRPLLGQEQRRIF